MTFYFASLSPEETTTREKLITVLRDHLNENPILYSEPDVIVVTAKELIFVEVKYEAKNDQQKTSTGRKWGLDSRVVVFAHANFRHQVRWVSFRCVRSCELVRRTAF